MVEGVLLDIDGVLTLSWEPLPGAARTIGWLKAHDVPFRLVTNTSSRTPAQIARILADAGMPVDAGHILTAVDSARHLLTERFPGMGALVVNEGELDLGDVPVVIDPERAAVVLLGGAGPVVTYDLLNTVFRLILRGAPVVALHRNTRFQTADGPALDMGAFLAGLEAAAEVDVIVVGKPSPEFYRTALAAVGADPDRVIMVGDDIASDVLGAQALGITGVLVRTGKFRPADLALGTPDHVVDTVADVPDLLTRAIPPGP